MSDPEYVRETVYYCVTHKPYPVMQGEFNPLPLSFWEQTMRMHVLDREEDLEIQYEIKKGVCNACYTDMAKQRGLERLLQKKDHE